MDLQKELDLLSDVLYENLEYFVDADTRKEAANALGYVATDFCINILHDFIENGTGNDSSVIAEAVRALGWAIDRRQIDRRQSEGQ